MLGCWLFYPSDQDDSTGLLVFNRNIWADPIAFPTILSLLRKLPGLYMTVAHFQYFADIWSYVDERGHRHEYNHVKGVRSILCFDSLADMDKALTKRRAKQPRWHEWAPAIWVAKEAFDCPLDKYLLMSEGHQLPGCPRQ